MKKKKENVIAADFVFSKLTASFRVNFGNPTLPALLIMGLFWFDACPPFLFYGGSFVYLRAHVGAVTLYEKTYEKDVI